MKIQERSEKNVFVDLQRRARRRILASVTVAALTVGGLTVACGPSGSTRGELVRADAVAGLARPDDGANINAPASGGAPPPESRSVLPSQAVPPPQATEQNNPMQVEANKLSRANPNIAPYALDIAECAQEKGFPPYYLAAVLEVESGNFGYVKRFHPDGTGRGIAGIDKHWHPEVSDGQAFDPHFASCWAASYLVQARRAVGGDLHNAYRWYNGGSNWASIAITDRNASVVDERAKKYA